MSTEMDLWLFLQTVILVAFLAYMLKLIWTTWKDDQ